MKRIKWFGLCILLILCEILILPGLTNISCVTAEAATIKINKSFLSLDVGQSYTLKITGAKSKIAWSSNNTNVVTVNSDGKVEAIAEGNAAITGKADSKKYTCRVMVKATEPDTVSNEDVLKNITYEEIEVGNGLIVIFEINNNVDLHLNTAVTFYDYEDQIVSTQEWNGFFNSKQTYVAFYHRPMDHSGQRLEYACYQLKVDAEELENSSVQNHAKEISIREGEKDNYRITTEIKNNSNNYFNDLEVAAVFYRNGRIVGCSLGYAQGLAGKQSTTITIDKPTDMYKSYRPFLYDNYKLYVNNAYTRQ